MAGTLNGRRVAILAASGVAAGHEPAFTSHLAATLMTMAQGGDGVAWLPATLAEADALSLRPRREPVLDRRTASTVREWK